MVRARLHVRGNADNRQGTKGRVSPPESTYKKCLREE